MGFIKWIKDKWNQTFIYIVDENTLREYIRREIDFSLKENLQASADMNIYLNGEKHHIQVWNFAASDDLEEKVKGLIIYFDDIEYRTIEEFMNGSLRYLPEYFKIELTLGDDVFLNEYKVNHPELREEEY